MTSRQWRGYVCLSVCLFSRFPLYLAETRMKQPGAFCFLSLSCSSLLRKTCWQWAGFDKCLRWQNAQMHAVLNGMHCGITNPNFSSIFCFCFWVRYLASAGKFICTSAVSERKKKVNRRKKILLRRIMPFLRKGKKEATTKSSITHVLKYSTRVKAVSYTHLRAHETA